MSILDLKAIVLTDKKYRCPKCRREEIIDQGEPIGCMPCDLEFDKSDLETFDEEDILARSEKQGIIKVFLDELRKN